MRLKKIICAVVAAAVLMNGNVVSAASISTLQNQKAQTEKEVNSIQSKIGSLESKRNEISGQINSLNDELTETLLNIDILEYDLEVKQQEIEQTERDLEEAIKVKERQYESMKLRIQFLYETGQESYIELLLTSDSFADLVNKVDYAEELEAFDSRLLEEYKEAQQAVEDLLQELEEEKEELLDLQEELEEEKANLERMIAVKKSEMADFDSQLSAARAKANEYKKKITQQNAQIKQLQAQAAAAAKAAAAAAAKNGTAAGGTSASGSKATVSGGGGGAGIASYGLQFVGHPYVAGGNSLTNGTDCSGFVNLVHAHFGISTPRQSGALAGSGRAVSDADKMPGDVVCYPGHVGIYIGNGQIVHASSAKTGIKVSNMYYRSITGIRRYW